MRKKTKEGLGFSNTSLKTAINHLTKIVIVGYVTMKHVIGIPMGIDPVPFWTNLFLYFYEEESMSTLISSDKIKT